MNTMLRNTVFAFLILAIAGAVFFCAHIGVIVAGHGVHTTLPDNSDPLAHVAHAKQIILMPISAISLISATVFFLAVFALLGIFQKFDLFLQLKPVLRSWRTSVQISDAAKQQTYYWLSLFERSPEFVTPA